MTNTPNTLSGTLQMFRQTSTITRARLRILTDMRERDQAVFWADWTQIPRDGRARIVQLLNEISEDNVDLDFRPVMRWLLADSDAEVRRRAIEGLSEEEQPRVIEPLLALMNGDPDPTVRIAAALGLARFTELAAMEELTPATSAQLRQALMTALMAEVNNVDLYRRILEALGWVSDDAVSSAVRMAWQSDKGALRESALVAMGRSGDTSWLPMVRDGLERGTPGVRYEAARACGDFADQAAALVPLLIVKTTMSKSPWRPSTPWAVSATSAHSKCSNNTPLAATPPNARRPWPRSKTMKAPAMSLAGGNPAPATAIGRPSKQMTTTTRNNHALSSRGRYQPDL